MSGVPCLAPLSERVAATVRKAMPLICRRVMRVSGLRGTTSPLPRRVFGCHACFHSFWGKGGKLRTPLRGRRFFFAVEGGKNCGSGRFLSFPRERASAVLFATLRRRSTASSARAASGGPRSKPARRPAIQGPWRLVNIFPSLAQWKKKCYASENSIFRT